MLLCKKLFGQFSSFSARDAHSQDKAPKTKVRQICILKISRTCQRISQVGGLAQVTDKLEVLGEKVTLEPTHHWGHKTCVPIQTFPECALFIIRRRTFELLAKQRLEGLCGHGPRITGPSIPQPRHCWHTQAQEIERPGAGEYSGRRRKKDGSHARSDGKATAAYVCRGQSEACSHCPGAVAQSEGRRKNESLAVRLRATRTMTASCGPAH